MKKLIISVVLATMIYGCASDRPQYNPQQFNNENYQQNVANAIDYADNFVDFDQANLPKASLDSNDFSVLLSADIAFNQGAYAKAGDSYYNLGIKYKDPRIIYKGIICLEHTSTTPQQFDRLNQLIELLVKEAPDSKISKLFGVQLAIDDNDVSKAEKNLNQVMKSKPSKPRAVLLFLATIIGNGSVPQSSDSLIKFAKYVEDEYSSYPESLLFATIVYSLTSNQTDLITTLDKIHTKYPNWEIPIYWSAGILGKHENTKLMNFMLQHEISRNRTPSVALQNLYIASLINSDKVQLAESYIESGLANAPDDGNLLVNKAIIQYKLGNNQSSIAALTSARAESINLYGSVDLALANLYSSEGKNESAIRYYQNVLSTNPLLSPAANMGIFRAYVANGQTAAADKFIDDLAVNAKLTPYDASVLKISLYIGMGKYEDAYQVAESKIHSYSHNRTFIYLYASLSGMTNRTGQAIKWYKKYISLYPMDPVGYNDLAFIYADKTSHLLDARRLAEKAYSLSPNDPAILDTLGWAYYKLGLYNKAISLLLPAYRMTQDRDTALHLKTAYLAIGDKAAANKVIVMSPNIEQMQLDRSLLNQAMLILMYYQYGLDLTR